MVLEDWFRKSIWDDYCELEFILKELKGLVQNPIDITEEVTTRHKEITNIFIEKLIKLNDELYGEV